MPIGEVVAMLLLGRPPARPASRVSLAVATTPRRRHLLGAAARVAAVPVLVVALAVAPVGGPPGSVWPAAALAAATCTGWTSDSVPPTTIRVLRTAGPASGSVQAVPFHDYVTVVMAAEWGSGNPAEVLKAGAVAVKEYAWYHAMFWRGGSAADGSCYDVVDSSMDQVFAPETRVPAAFSRQRSMPPGGSAFRRTRASS
jgi:peptidoglycan hydrolase-like amidase